MKRRKITIELVRSEFAKEGYWLLTKKYINAYQKLEYICPKGHRGSICWHDFQQGRRCSVCANNHKRLAIGHIKESFAKEGYQLLSTVYINNRQKLKYICSNGHHWSITWSDWKRGRRCPECAGVKKLTIEHIRKAFAKEGYWLLTKIYTGAFQKLRYRCPRGHYWSISWGSWSQGVRCPKCYFENNKGSNNPNFNPNLTDKERQQDRSLIIGYKEWRTAVFERDNYTCQVCGKHGGKLNAHHLFSYRSYPELQLVLDNGICLCEPCHNLFHHMFGYGNNTREQFEEFKRIFAAKRKS